MRRREREELETLRSEADAKLQAARDAVHEAERVKKDVESARKENEAAATNLMRMAASASVYAATTTAAPPSAASALPTPRQLQLGTPAATPVPVPSSASRSTTTAGRSVGRSMTTTYAGDIVTATATGGRRGAGAGAGVGQQQQPPGSAPAAVTGAGAGGAAVPDYYLRATLARLATTLEERFKEAERKLQRASNLASGEAYMASGGKTGEHDGIGRLRARLVKLTTVGRKLAAQAGAATAAGGGGGGLGLGRGYESSATTTTTTPGPVTQALVSQLEAQERHMAAWFADLQWQLEGIFSSTQSRMPGGATPLTTGGRSAITSHQRSGSGSGSGSGSVKKGAGVTWK